MEARTLEGKVAIVTGAGRGIGRGIALALGAEGAKVVVASRTASTVEAVAQEIRDAGGEAIGVACDVGKRDQVFRPACSRRSTPSARVHIVVNNAQGFGTEASPQRLDRLRRVRGYRRGRVGIYAPHRRRPRSLWFMKAVFPHMKAAGLRQDHQLRVELGPDRVRGQHLLQRHQGGDPRAHPHGGARMGPARHQRQRHQPGARDARVRRVEDGAARFRRGAEGEDPDAPARRSGPRRRAARGVPREAGLGLHHRLAPSCSKAACTRCHDIRKRGFSHEAAALPAGVVRHRHRCGVPALGRGVRRRAVLHGAPPRDRGILVSRRSRSRPMSPMRSAISATS